MGKNGASQEEEPLKRKKYEKELRRLQAGAHRAMGTAACVQSRPYGPKTRLHRKHLPSLTEVGDSVEP